MGRLKRERRKFHLKAVGSRDLDSANSKSELNLNEDATLPLPKISDTIFSGISISVSKMKSSAEELEEKSVWFRKSVLKLTEREKRMLRCDAFPSKIEAFYRAEKEKKLAKKRKETVITGDMKPLLDALPTLCDFSSSIEEKVRANDHKERSTLKTRRRQNDLLANIEAFKSMLQNPEFQENPTEIVNKNILQHSKFVSQYTP